MTILLYKGKGSRVVLGKFMEPGETREVTERQAKQLVASDKTGFEILKPKKAEKPTAQPDLLSEAPAGSDGVS